jgi:uncharacterized membrane protein YqaE (UPF0057 family)
MKKIIMLFALGIFCTGALQASSSETEPSNKSTATGTTNVAKEPVLDDAVTMDAMREFKSLSRVERKMRLSNAKKAIKEYKEAKKSGTASDTSTNTLLLVILAILLPPLAVALHEGGINTKFWISLLLTLCFWIPGVIYALIVIL